MLKICFTAFNAYPVIAPESGGAIGGVETRAWMLARALAAVPEMDVSFVVRHHEQPKSPTVDGVRLVPVVDPLFRIREAVATMASRSPRFPWIRLKGFAPSLLWQLPLVGFDFLRRRLLGRAIDYRAPMEPIASTPADVYATFGVVNMTSASVIASAHARGRRAVLFLGSDSDLDERFTPDSTYVSPYGDPAPLCAWILQNADVIVAQTPWQQATLRERFERDSTVIPNPIDHETWDRGLANPLPDSETCGLARYVLWVGRAEGVHKRPQLMVEVARRCPEVDFLMVLNPREPVLEALVRRDAPPNLRIVSQVPFPRMPGLFAKATSLVSTSSLEGFPNVFLQSAVSRVPIASLVVAEDFLARTGAGRCFSQDLDGLCNFVRELWQAGLPRVGLDAARETVLRENGLAARVADVRDVLVKAARGGEG